VNAQISFFFLNFFLNSVNSRSVGISVDLFMILKPSLLLPFWNMLSSVILKGYFKFCFQFSVATFVCEPVLSWYAIIKCSHPQRL